jgi:hypothetical protein
MAAFKGDQALKAVLVCSAYAPMTHARRSHSIHKAPLDGIGPGGVIPVVRCRTHPYGFHTDQRGFQRNKASGHDSRGGHLLTQGRLIVALRITVLRPIREAHSIPLGQAERVTPRAVNG